MRVVTSITMLALLPALANGIFSPPVHAAQQTAAASAAYISQTPQVRDDLPQIGRDGTVSLTGAGEEDNLSTGEALGALAVGTVLQMMADQAEKDKQKAAKPAHKPRKSQPAQPSVSHDFVNTNVNNTVASAGSPNFLNTNVLDVLKASNNQNAVTPAGGAMMPEGYFKLTTMFREGSDECLEGNEVNRAVMGGVTYMNSCQNVTGQLWLATPADNGYFRLTTMYREDANECLEGNEVNRGVKGGAAYLDKCQNVSGQLWKMIPAGNGYFKLTTMFREGANECLEGNQVSGSAMHGAAFMDHCQNVSGQLWKVIQVGTAEFRAARDGSGEPMASAGGVTVQQAGSTTAVSTATAATTATAQLTNSAAQLTDVSANFSLGNHFDHIHSAVDMNACGVSNRGHGGFGKRRVRTNSHGDVHIFTPDGLTYDFQAEGEFLLVASDDFEVMVEARQTITPSNPGVSSNTAVAFKVGDDIVEFYSDEKGQRLYVNGEATNMPTATLALAGGGSIEPDGMGKSGPRFLINWAGDIFTARVNLYAQFLNVGVAGTQGHEYSGLLGNLDGNPQNDMLPRGGSALICPKAGVNDLIRFGDSWRLSPQETLLRAEWVEATDTQTQASNFVSLVTDSVSGERLSTSTAMSRMIEQNFAGLGNDTEIDVSTLTATFESLFGTSEQESLTAVSTFFGEKNLSVSDKISVSKMNTQVTSYQESYQRVSVEAIDETVRAKAQRICQANGVTDDLALVNCLLDVVSTKSETYVESAAGFAETIADIPHEQRMGGTEFADVTNVNVILPKERVTEIVGSADQVPDISTLVFNWSEPVKEKIVTVVKSDITSTFNQTACADVNPPTPVEELEKQPQAGGVAIFCATHARGQTVTVELGRTLEEALARAQASCPAAAEARTERWGPVIIPCREIGRGERKFDFGGGVLSIGRDVTVTQITKIVEKSQVPPGLKLTPEPGLTADCMEGESIPLDGLTVVGGLLQYVANAASDFQNMCTESEIKETEDDVLLQASCINEEGSDARTSAISLLGVAAMKALIEHPKCAPPAPEPEPAPQPEAPMCTPDPATAGLPEAAAFTPITEDGLPSDFPDSGDFVLVRNSEAGIEIHARREPWIADMNQSAITALQFMIGGDSVEIYATPQQKMLVNGGTLQQAGVGLEGNSVGLPGGGSMDIEADTQALVFHWPGTSFAMAVRVFSQSHIMPIIRRDPALSYEGLARFAEDWQLDSGESGFSQPPSGRTKCNTCKANTPPDVSMVGVPEPNFGPEEPQSQETPEPPANMDHCAESDEGCGGEESTLQRNSEPPANPEPQANPETDGNAGGEAALGVLRMLLSPDQ